jgi:hypothetical protein
MGQILPTCFGTPLTTLTRFSGVPSVCGKAARTNLCGGREVTRAPTAKTRELRASFVAVHESASGTPRRFAAVRRFGRDGSEADMPRASEAGRSDENDPKETSAPLDCCCAT